MRFVLKHLYLQVVIAFLIGIFFGVFYPDAAVAMKPFGDAFIKLIKMIVAPIIFCTVVLGIVGMKNMKLIGKTLGFALIYFEIVSLCALLLGLVLVNLLQPGAGMNIDPSTLDKKSVEVYTTAEKMESPSAFLLHIIPNAFVDAFAKGDILQVMLIALLFGFALHAAGAHGQLIVDFIEKLSHVFFGIVAIIMRFAPVGVFGSVAFTVGKYGFGTLLPLAQLMAAFYLTCLTFIFAVLGLIAYLHGFSIWKLIKYLKEEIFIVLGTSSSESVLPRLLAKFVNLGVDKSVVGLVIPTGYTFNLDGTAIYLTMATVFIAQATNTPLSYSEQFVILMILLLTSKGAAAVTGGGFVVLAGTLAAVGSVPVAGLALILGIDRFMSEARAITNLIGNGVAAIVVGKWCGEVNQEKLKAHLNNETFIDANEPESELVARENHNNLSK